MAGNKNSGNRTGRPSKYMQVQKGNLLDICTEFLIDNFHTFDRETQIRIALTIAPKGITEKREVEVKAEVTVKHESLQERLSCFSAN